MSADAPGLTAAWGYLPSPALSERRHRRLARRGRRSRVISLLKVPGVPKLVPLGGPLDRVL